MNPYRESRELHLPDLLFIERCREQFGINRGVYNTIDIWMFHHGWTDVVELRERIQEFLAVWKRQAGDRIVIGPGNLTKRLQEDVGAKGLPAMARAE
ncbi:hypothetical protein [Ectobacillus ponti]|uniref:Uncharacterized protein n=1 Tax=Ectobacillus ponti TaxID=2961894 RepID=A0AA41X940_9BACI|nr:hypothetical protein [Ectobacillus ponti]MCP8971072.1 hypothetical protein [Ectobacillus ponti]